MVDCFSRVITKRTRCAAFLLLSGGVRKCYNESMSAAFIPTTHTTTTKKTDLLGLTLPELQQWLAERGEAPFRAKQIYAWLFQRLVTDFSAMTNLSLAL